jgi:hypothetical protein
MLAFGSASQSPFADDPKTLLLEVRKKILFTLKVLPKYLCTETAERSMMSPAAPVCHVSCDDLAAQKKRSALKLRETESDRLRLAVAVSGDSEMYSWVGEDRFENPRLADLVKNGATSGGSFATLLASIFGTNNARFSYNGNVNVSGTEFAEFGFVVPLEKSNYTVGNNMRHAVVGYGGTFRVDIPTLNLQRLTVYVAQLPQEIGACDDMTVLDYGTVRLNGSEILLPKSVQLQVVNSDGSELDNHTSFSGCRELKQLSTFDSGGVSAPADAGNRTARTDLALPSGLSFTVVLTQPIKTASAAAGDITEMKLKQAIRDTRKQKLAAENSEITARILQVERFYGLLAPEVQSLRVGIELETIKLAGLTYSFHGNLDSMAIRRAAPLDNAANHETLGQAERMIRRADPGIVVNEKLLSLHDIGTGYLLFDDVKFDYVIDAGFKIKGKTATRP